ncbi:MAG: hypothetical protein ACREXY_27190, partial [Gammaproteobacteria bacterium]
AAYRYRIPIAPTNARGSDTRGFVLDPIFGSVMMLLLKHHAEKNHAYNHSVAAAAGFLGCKTYRHSSRHR